MKSSIIIAVICLIALIVSIVFIEQKKNDDEKRLTSLVEEIKEEKHQILEEEKQEYQPNVNLYFGVLDGSQEYTQTEIDSYNKWLLEEKKKAIDDDVGLSSYKKNILRQLDFLNSRKDKAYD